MDPVISFWLLILIGIAVVYVIGNAVFGKGGLGKKAADGEGGSSGHALDIMAGLLLLVGIGFDIINNGPIGKGLLGLVNWILTAGGLIDPIDVR